MSDDVTRVGAAGLAPEQTVNLDDFFEEPGGNIPPGWYDAEVLEGYATGKGTQFATSDGPGTNGQRVLRFCFGLNVSGNQRNLQKSFFYTPDQFEAENLARIKNLREQFAKVKSWPGQGQAQGFSISLGMLSQLQKAVGFTLAKHPTGGFMTQPYVGKKLKVRVSTGKKGYDEVTGFRPR